MPNFRFSDEEMTTCAHCNQVHRCEELHFCHESLADAEAENRAWEEKFTGDGQIRGRLVVDFVCYNSEEAIQMVIGDMVAGVFYGEGRSAGFDDILQYSWQARLDKVKIP